MRAPSGQAGQSSQGRIFDSDPESLTTRERWCADRKPRSPSTKSWRQQPFPSGSPKIKSAGNDRRHGPRQLHTERRRLRPLWQHSHQARIPQRSPPHTDAKRILWVLEGWLHQASQHRNQRGHINKVPRYLPAGSVALPMIVRRPPYAPPRSSGPAPADRLKLLEIGQSTSTIRQRPPPAPSNLRGESGTRRTRAWETCAILHHAEKDSALQPACPSVR